MPLCPPKIPPHVVNQDLPGEEPVTNLQPNQDITVCTIIVWNAEMSCDAQDTRALGTWPESPF
jgi:hypothetical protein